MTKARRQKFIQALPIEQMAAEGKCIARDNGKVIFVKGVAPGDVVDIRIVKKKKGYLEGVPVAFHQYSENRVEAFCQHFGECGGCQWQHVPYSMQTAHKQQQVIDSLERIAKVKLPDIFPILSAENTQYYRNKLEFTFSTDRWLTQEEIDSDEALDKNALGFHRPQSFNKVLPIQHCHLQPDPSNAIRLAIDKYAKQKGLSYYNIKSHEGLLRTLIIRTTNIGEVMVIVQFGEEAERKEAQPLMKDLLTYIQSRFPEITSLQYIINPKKNDTYADLDVHLFEGKPFITEKMEGLSFQIGPKSFFQTNSQQAYVLYKTAREFAGLQGDETVYDLYTGTGTIANFIAKSAQKVIGIEYIPEAIEDAKVNAMVNEITNTEFFAGDIKETLQEDFISLHGKPDVLITDPPRSGMHKDVVKQILETAPEKIVYVSCNPATQARDIALLDEKYKVEKIQPVDMFPHTHHVENVVLLRLAQ